MRNCPKSPGCPYNLALRAIEMGSSGRFGVCILAKATVETLLRPLFGQFQNRHSRKPVFMRPHTYMVSGRRQAGLIRELPRRVLPGNSESKGHKKSRGCWTPACEPFES